MTLLEATEFLRKMHLTAPFCFFNGNTFVTIIRDSITALSSKLPGGEAIALRTRVGHCVAGTMSLEELEEIIESLPEVDPS